MNNSLFIRAEDPFSYHKYPDPTHAIETTGLESLCEICKIYVKKCMFFYHDLELKKSPINHFKRKFQILQVYFREMI